MYRLIDILVTVLLINVIPTLHGYKWVTPKNGSLPKNSVALATRKDTERYYNNRYEYDDYQSTYQTREILVSTKYVGRARHFGELLPAEVYNSSYATIYSCSKIIIKSHFEVLVTQEHCEWEPYTPYSYIDIPENIVYVGHYQDNEPIYAARSKDQNSNVEIASLLLKTQKIVSHSPNVNEILTCNDDEDWIDVAATALLKNMVSGGLSHNNHSIFVARIKDSCNIFPAQATPELGIAINERQKIKSPFCQVLVGEPGDYTWETAEGGLIPDYAIVSGKTGTELQYIARINKSLVFLTYSMAFKEQDPYEILVKVL